MAKAYHAASTATSHGLHELDVASGFDFAQAMEHVKSIVDGVYSHEQPEIFHSVGIDTYIHTSGATFGTAARFLVKRRRVVVGFCVFRRATFVL